MHLPVGTSNFRKLIEYKDPNGEGYLFIDKSLLIKEIIYDLTEVIVLTRPRRFGKTLNLSMLHHFFSANVEGQATNGLFDVLNISKQAKCMQHQGKYYVIFITLKDAKYKTFDLCFEYIKKQIAKVYAEYRFLLTSEQLDPEEQLLFKQILEKNANQVDWDESLKSLTEFIKKATGQQAVILIDEYDTPIQEAYLHDYYDDLIDFMRKLFSSALKDNASLGKAILTGILRVSKESLFSGLSNVEIYSVLHKKYSNFFGFTETETNELLHKAKLPIDLEKTKEWYNGYNFGGTTIYNPWSIIKFIKEEGKIGTYWVHTSGNDLIRELVIKSDSDTQSKLGQLITGNVLREVIDEHIVFHDLRKNPAAIWSLLLMTGYLKVVTVNVDVDGNEECCLAIPNKEIESLYKRLIREWLSGSRGLVWYEKFLTALTTGRIADFELMLQEVIKERVSYFDTGKSTNKKAYIATLSSAKKWERNWKKQENFYHTLMLGIMVGLKDTHEVRSNRESGDGRYDLQIAPKNPKELGIIMEFKAAETKEKLEEKAKEALQQIKISAYSTELCARGITNICSMGIAFSGKAIKVVTDYDDLNS